MHKLLLRTLPFFFITAICSGVDQSEISGKWAADIRTKGGLGSSWIFGKDGTGIICALQDINRITIHCIGRAHAKTGRAPTAELRRWGHNEIKMGA